MSSIIGTTQYNTIKVKIKLGIYILKFTFKSRGHFEESIEAIFSEGFIKNGISVWTTPKDSSLTIISLDFLLFFFFKTGKTSK